MSLSIESPSFENNAMIPQQYTCDGGNQSPPLMWDDSSPQTQSYVLIVDDPDAPGGTWVHWVLFNIPANIKQLAAATAMPVGATSGRNSWGSVGYRGPCPPSGTHRYFFKVYALDTRLDLDESATAQDVLRAMQNHVIAKGELISLYTREF